MSRSLEHAHEQTRLLESTFDRRPGPLEADENGLSISRLSYINRSGDRDFFPSDPNERLPYNGFATVDLLRDLEKDSLRHPHGHVQKCVRHRLFSIFDACQGWIMAALIGCLTACVAFLVDIAEATVSDWKFGYCAANIFSMKENCCIHRGVTNAEVGGSCNQWHRWVPGFWKSFAVFLGFSLSFGIISASATTSLTKANLPVAAPRRIKKDRDDSACADIDSVGKTMYLAAGSGIPEIKAILSGFTIPHYLDSKVMAVKAFGAVFAVATASLVGRCVPRFRDNGRKMRELLSAGCSSGLAVAFGAPIGGVLFSYEEISTYFPRKVLWRAFVSSLVAAMVLKALNPSGTGRLVLFETKYGTSYRPCHYLVFVLLGIVGGLFGGVFCKANFLWSKSFRTHALIKDHPVLEVFCVVLVTVLLQYPNPMTREPGDIILKHILMDCRGSRKSWMCEMEARESRPLYIGWLVYGSMSKLILTTITFGCKVPSGIIIPALDAGAFFGRLVGQWVTTLSPGIFAMVGAAAFLAGVSRMTISLCVIMFELTGELEYIVPDMIAIIVAKWVADCIESQSVYDLAQNVSGLPFLDLDHIMGLVQEQHAQVETLIPPEKTMREISIEVPTGGMVSSSVLDEKLEQLKRRGIIDGGLVLVQNDMLQGYLSEAELESGLDDMGEGCSPTSRVQLLGRAEGEFDLSIYVDRTPLTINAKAPIEYAVEMFGKLGLGYICVVEEVTGKLVGLIVKKRLLSWLESLKR